MPTKTKAKAKKAKSKTTAVRRKSEPPSKRMVKAAKKKPAVKQTDCAQNGCSKDQERREKNG